ncbi:hypothetical protein DFP72DRAFT_847595 [Ephemerocybe angulata]|uniref:Uncharacterized protein n=1 Tax=Ephemerocybe angulata TaxID=980116 RepID=A0A8H6I005_9AGAR|nr:hypothetical protein DFP72DRAFT_847595 [Tulosesus angulatus]
MLQHTQENTEAFLTPSELPSLTQWSKTQITSIFEASSDFEAMRAIDRTFAKDVDARMNGVSIDIDAIRGQVLDLRRSSKRGLRVRWKKVVEVPSEDNRGVSNCIALPVNGTFIGPKGYVGAAYVIEGVTKFPPQHPLGVEYERHKVVTVKIGPRREANEEDGRRILAIAFVAKDTRVGGVAEAAL